MRFTQTIAMAACMLSAPAFAQETGEAPLPDPETAARTWTVAAGVGYTPDYIGSDNYRLIPAAAVRGTIGSVSLTTRATYLYADFVPRGEGIDFDVGPIIGARFNRTSKTDDKVVDLLPERNTAIEVGGFAGISLHNVTNPYDSLSFRLDVLHDFADAHESTVISPSIDFSTPLSRKTFVSASLGMDFVSNKFADYYFSVSPAESTLTGGVLPVFDADGGMKNWKLGALVNQSITGDLTGGLSVFGTASYSKLVGDFKDTPIVSDRGSSSQWLLAAGLAYTF